MRTFLAFIVLMTILAGCTTEKPSEHALIQVKENQQVQDIPFEKGQGSAFVVFEKGGVDCIIYAKGLKTDGRYLVSLVRNNGASSVVVVTFGPKENVQIRAGSFEGEMTFKPNSEGELFVSMRNPIQMMTGAKELIFQLENKDRKEMMKTAPFTLDFER